MKTNYLLAYLFCFGIFFSSCSKDKEAGAEPKGIYTPVEYEYLRYTDLEKWKSLSHAEKVESSQIPYNLLNQMPTYPLLELCLSYPLLSDIFQVEDKYHHTFNRMIQTINVFTAFYNRKDAGACIIRAYKENKPKDILENESKDNVPYVFLFVYLDLMTAQKPLTDQMSSYQRFDLLSLLAENVEQRKIYNLYYSPWFEHSTLAMGYIFKKENIILTTDPVVAQRIDDFLLTASYYPEIIDLILQEAMKYKK